MLGPVECHDMIVPHTEREPYALLRVRTEQGWQFIEDTSVEAVKEQERALGYGDLVDAPHWFPYDQRKLFQVETEGLSQKQMDSRIRALNAVVYD